MLDSMTPREFDEWCCYYKITSELPEEDKPQGGLKGSTDAMRRMAGM